MPAVAFSAPRFLAIALSELALLRSRANMGKSCAPRVSAQAVSETTPNRPKRIRAKVTPQKAATIKSEAARAVADFQVKPEEVVKAELLEDDEWSETRLSPVGHPDRRVYQQRGYEKNRIDRSGGCRNKKAEMAARACRLHRESDERILPARLPDEPLDSCTRKLECRIAALERQKASRTTWWSNAWC